MPATDARAEGQRERTCCCGIPLLPLWPAPPSRSHSYGRVCSADCDVEAGPSAVSSMGASTAEPDNIMANIAMCLTKDKARSDNASDATASNSSSELDMESLDKFNLLIQAIQRREAEAVKQLLKEGAPLSHHGRFGYTPMHEAIQCCLYSFKKGTPSEENLRADTVKVIQELLKACNDRKVLNSFDNEGDSPMSLAIKSEHLEIIKELVQAGADVNRISEKHRTALHEAARKSYRILKYFIDMCTIENTIDDDGLAAIHCAASSDKVETVRLLLGEFGQRQLTLQTGMGWTVWHEIVSNQAIKVAHYLLQSGDGLNRLGLNIVDNFGRSPVLLSIEKRDADMTALLLRYGAALSVEGEKKNAIEQITTKFANPMQFLKNLFDECIYEEKEKVIVNYELLVDNGNKGKSQVDVIGDLVKCGHSKLLKHPLIESLMYIKWRRFLPVFYAILGTYVVFMLSLNVFVVTKFNKLDSNETPCANRTVNEAQCDEGCEWFHWVLSATIYISVIVLFIQEWMWVSGQELCLFPSLNSFRRISLKSFKKLRLEPWVKLGGLLLALAVPPVVGCEPSPAPWRRHVVCAALLLAWVQAMLLLSRFPGWGHYVLMFERVSLNILTIFVTSICLVIGFSICFMVQFQTKPPFDGFLSAFVKTLVMMSSEFDYEDLFYEKHDNELKDSIFLVRLLFVVFVIFVAIVLMNFMTGVAVRDFNELAPIGDVRRLEKQLELLSTLERLGSTELGKRWERLSSIRFHRQIEKDLQVNDPFKTTYYSKKKWMVYPSEFKFDSFQQTLTTEMQISILEIVNNKKQAVNKLDALYEAVVEIPDNTKRRNVSDDSKSSVRALKDKITSIEATNKDVIRDLNKVNDMIQSIKDENKAVIKSINDLKDDIKSIILIMARKKEPQEKRKSCIF